MPSILNTPESLLSRADSKNPHTTCRGLTSNGRPCRRALASTSTPTKSSSSPHSSQSSSPASSASSSPQSLKFPLRVYNGVYAVGPDKDDKDVINAAFFCWQHKDQAAAVMHVVRDEVVELQGRSSIDTLVERFGILEVKGEKDGIVRMASRRGVGGGRVRPVRPVEEVDDGRMVVDRKEQWNAKPQERRQSRPSLWSLLCCFSPPSFDYDNGDPLGHRRHEPRHHDTYSRRPEMTMHSTSPPSITRPPPAVPHHSRPHQHNPSTPRHPLAPPQPPSPASPIYNYNDPASLIPSHLPSTTRTALLNELTKPLSPKDEAGYIYIFRLDPSANNAEDGPTHAFSSASAGADGRLLVKIGRTNNVHRRLTSWSKQCGYTLSLLRFYPYLSSTPQSSPTHLPPHHHHQQHQQQQPQPRSLPNTHRIERLIHIELSAQRVKQAQCGKCGREHREWFEVEASREGVRRVDEVVRRWVGWGEWVGGRN